MGRVCKMGWPRLGAGLMSGSLGLLACGPGPAPVSAPATPAPSVASAKPGPVSREPHLKELKQLTTGGENAEAYWSFDGKQLIFQAHHGEG